MISAEYKSAYQQGYSDAMRDFRKAHDKIRGEVLEYIDDLDIAAEICDIFDRYETKSEKRGYK